MDKVLECKNLNKSYGKKEVLNGFDLTLFKGQVFGLLGPNGSGKTTLIKLIAGLLTANEGEILIGGRPRDELSNALIAYLPERNFLNKNETAQHMVGYYAAFFEDFDSEKAYAMLADLHIPLDVKLHSFSKGTLEKVQLILTMSRRARLYLLDEPLGGVDPAARDYVLKTVILSKTESSAMLISTHLIEDVEGALTDFAFISPEGRIILSGCAEEVRQKEGKSLNELFKEVFRYV